MILTTKRRNIMHVTNKTIIGACIICIGFALTSCTKTTPEGKALKSCSIFVQSLRGFQLEDPIKTCSCFISQSKKSLTEPDYNFLLNTMNGKANITEFSEALSLGHKAGKSSTSALAVNIHLVGCF